jgi:hypothetical protein
MNNFSVHKLSRTHLNLLALDALPFNDSTTDNG